MKNSSWALSAAAVLTGVMGLQLINVRQMGNRVDTLSAQVVRLQSSLNQLVGAGTKVGEANDLLSNLIVQGQRTESAQAAIEKLRELDREVRAQGYAAGQSLQSISNIGRLHQQIAMQNEELPELSQSIESVSAFHQQVHGLASAATREYAGVDRAMQLVRELGQLKNHVAAEGQEIASAFNGLGKLVSLKKSVVAEASDLGQAEASLNQLSQFKQRVATESEGLEIAETQFARLIGLQKAVASTNAEEISTALSRMEDFVRLQSMLIEEGDRIQAATEVGRQMAALQEDLITQGARIDVARKHADGLLSLEDALADDANLDLDHARANLEGLVSLERRLASQDQQIVSAVETLELMIDLQAELVERIGSLERLRTGLTELAMMESSILRTVRALEPLVEITSLRRLNSSDLQNVVRGMLDLRSSGTRVAAGDPQDLPVGEDFSASTRISRNTEESLVPIPPAQD